MRRALVDHARRRPGLASSEVRAWATAHAVVLDAIDVGGELERWLRPRGLDFVLVRPDRRIFSAGAAADLARAQAAFSRRG